MGKLVRKYGKRKSGNRVTIDPNPKIGYREDEELYSSENEVCKICCSVKSVNLRFNF